jgi:hypothetical protein
MDNLLDILESILLQNDKTLSINELQISLNTIDDIIKISHSLKNSILNIMINKYKDDFLENEIYYDHFYKSKLIINVEKENKPKATTKPTRKSKKENLATIIEKIGGYPTLKRGEIWPIARIGEHIFENHVTFIAQFKLPENQNILYRIFAYIQNKATNYILIPLVIKETNKYLKNCKLSFPDCKIIKEYIIQEWEQHKELKPFNEIYTDKNIECKQAAYDSIVNSIANSNIKKGIELRKNIINGKKLMFTIPADLIEFTVGLNLPQYNGIYYFYDDESMEFLER